MLRYPPTPGLSRASRGTALGRRPWTRVVRAFGVLAAAVAIAVASAGGTYSLWSASAATGEATISAGTAGLAVSPESASLAGVYPGSSGTRRAAVSVSNTGDVPLTLGISSLARTSASTAFADSLTIGVATVASAAECTDGTPTPTWSGTFATWSPGSLVHTVVPEATAVLCISAALPSDAANGMQGSSADFSLTVSGLQQ